MGSIYCYIGVNLWMSEKKLQLEPFLQLLSYKEITNSLTQFE